jgi:hypothetical protein
VGITGFGDQADGLALLQQRIAVGGEKVPASSMSLGNWRTNKNVLADSVSDSETSTPNRLWMGAMASGAAIPRESSMAPAVAIERYSPSGPQRHAISHSRLRLRISVGFA